MSPKLAVARPMPAETIAVVGEGLVLDAAAAVLDVAGYRVRRLGDTSDATSLQAIVASDTAEPVRSFAAMGLPIVLLVASDPSGPEHIGAVLAGVDAVVHLNASSQQLVEAVAAVLRGEVFLDPRLVKAMLDTTRRTSGRVEHPNLRLTPRERSVLDCIVRGESVKQTARTLGVAVKTVENTQSRLYRRLGVRNRAQAVIAAHEMGLV